MKSTTEDWINIDCILKHDRIDIWQFPLHAEFNHAEALLDETEKNRAKRYHFARHQRRFTVARAMMRVILAKYLNTNPLSLIFSYEKHGKPRLHHPSEITFNISHSDDLALLAVGQTFPLGVDLEFFSARPYEGIAKNLFSIAENQALKEATAALKPLVFFKIWTQKEAFIKTCGLGLAYPTQEFTISAYSQKTETVLDPLNETSWQMSTFMPQIACPGALCCHTRVHDLRFVSIMDLKDVTKHL
ncbi:MAG: 4'-phosphopantetheinyl transferase superfamily protein [Legionellales bacterium]|nr:4'-phosphopantetheinyl transferase superfamily protein [Legionellales bacterium]